MGITMSGVLVKRIGRHFGNLKEARRVLSKQEELAQTVSDLDLVFPILCLLRLSRTVLGGSCPSKPTGY